jgi:hypothetical protein
VKVDAVPAFERAFANPVLLGMVVAATAHGEPVGRLAACPGIASGANVHDFDRSPAAPRHNALVIANECAMCLRAPPFTALLWLWDTAGKGHNRLS